MFKQWYETASGSSKQGLKFSARVPIFDGPLLPKNLTLNPYDNQTGTVRVLDTTVLTEFRFGYDFPSWDVLFKKEQSVEIQSNFESDRDYWTRYFIERVTKVVRLEQSAITVYPQWDKYDCLVFLRKNRSIQNDDPAILIPKIQSRSDVTLLKRPPISEYLNGN